MVNCTRMNSVQSIFPSSSNITRCQVPSRVRAWFHDSAGVIDFYQMSPSQSESTILQESIILYVYHMAWRVTYQNIRPEVTRKLWRVMSPDAEGSIELIEPFEKEQLYCVVYCNALINNQIVTLI